MKDIVAYVVERKEHIRNNHPFLKWLDDKSVSPEKRLGSWLPRLAPLVMGFRDLNKSVLVYPSGEVTTDPLKIWINNYVHDLYKSGLYYEEDLTLLGMNREMSFGDTLRFFWHENKSDDRMLFYRICQISIRNPEPIYRYVTLLSTDDLIENVLFAKTREITEEYVRAGGHGYFKYLGKKRPNLYSPEFLKVELNVKEREKVLAIADEIMDYVEGRWHGFLKASTEEGGIWA